MDATMTHEEIASHMKKLRQRAAKMALEDYPSGDEDKLKKCRCDVDNLRRDLKLLEFLSKWLPNVTTHRIGF
jgi:hypothetical protein